MAAAMTAKQIKDYIRELSIYEKEAFVLIVSKYIYLEDKEAKLSKKSEDEKTEEEKRQEDKLKDLTLANVNKQLEPFLNKQLRVKRTRKTPNGKVEEYKEVVTLNHEMGNIADIWNQSDAKTRNGFLDTKINQVLGFKKKYSVEDIKSAIQVEVAHMKAPIIASSAEAIRRLRPTSRNLFPDLRDPSTLNTLERLNAFIEEKYREKLGDEAERTIATGQTIGRYLKPYKAYTFTDFRCMHSEGSNSDCLIHSFLTATCPAFRRLTSQFVSEGRGRDKNEFATWFREYVYPAMPAVQRQLTSEHVDMTNKITTGLITHQRIFTRGTFLSDTDIGLLARIYNQNIISFQGAIQVGGQRQEAAVYIATINEATPCIMISNERAIHFEAAQTPEGSYTIPYKVATQIQTIVDNNASADVIAAAKNALRRPPSVNINDRANYIERMLKSEAANAERKKGTNASALTKRYGDEWNAAAKRREEEAKKMRANVNSNDRPTYIGKMMKSEAANEFRAEGLNDETLKDNFAAAWNMAKKKRNEAAAAAVAASTAAGNEEEQLKAAIARSLAEKGGSRRTRRSLRPRRRHTSKAKGHGRRRTRKHKS